MKLGPNSRVHKMPSDIKKDAGVLVEPLACAIHAVERGEIQLGDTVTLAGAGTLGLLMLQIIKLKNPGQIIVTDAKPERLERARALGATHTVNVKEQDVVAEVKKLTGGYGTDVFIEATGYAGAVPQGLDMLRKLGTFVAFGVFGDKATADWSIIGDRKELDVRGAHLGPYCYPIAIDLLARGLVTSKGIVTHDYALEQWDEAIAVANSLDSIKVLMKPVA
jgi:L-iditol 2-dehydrogenase